MAVLQDRLVQNLTKQDIDPVVSLTIQKWHTKIFNHTHHFCVWAHQE